MSVITNEGNDKSTKVLLKSLKLTNRKTCYLFTLCLKIRQVEETRLDVIATTSHLIIKGNAVFKVDNDSSKTTVYINITTHVINTSKVYGP